MHVYDSHFFEYINTGARRSASAVISVVLRELAVTSVVDFGCGQGAWMAEWRARGIADVTGVDGSYVDPANLLVPADSFIAHDLTRPIALGRRFDLVQSAEVAEHLPPAAAPTFVDNLTAHGDVVLFSAAAPGQGGEHHVNEQPYEYWHRLFAVRGFELLDFVRPQLAGDRSIEPWYRYNTLVFVRTTRLPELSAALRASLVPLGQPIPDVSPALYRVRKRVIGVLPVWASTALAVAKKHCHITFRRHFAASAR
jgi:SAM-dependent methyltransferase